MPNFLHSKSIEFGLAESLWPSVDDRNSKLRAIVYYKMACKKNDARAFLALYKINKEWINSYLIIGKQHDGLHYLNGSLVLGYLPAFLYAAGCDDIFSIYQRLIYLSLGLSLAEQRQGLSVDDFQREFLKLSEKFAIEFIPEIIEIGKSWIPGTPIRLSDSALDGQLIPHPFKFDVALDSERLNWQIFPVRVNLEEYLRQLPGDQDYQLAYEEAYSPQFEELMKQAAQKGNGQAMYALDSYGDLSQLVKFAENGSPDGFIDLMASISKFPEDFEFTNSSKLKETTNMSIFARIDCLVYLYTLMERLGLEKYGKLGIDASHLSSDSDTGYETLKTDVKELKYQLCEHLEVERINDRAFQWQLGYKFDFVFYEKLAVLTLND